MPPELEPQIPVNPVEGSQGLAGQPSVVDPVVEVPPAPAPSLEEERARYEGLLQSAKSGASLSDEDLEFADYWESQGQYKKPEEVKPNPEVGGKLPEPAADPEVPEYLASVLQKVGAKSVEELPAKVEGLIQHLGKQGNELGQSVKALEAENRALTKLFDDLSAGVPEAIEFVRQRGLQIPPSVEQKPQGLTLESFGINREDVVDETLLNGFEKMLQLVNGMNQKLEGTQSQAQQVQQQVAQQLQVQEMHTKAYTRVAQFVAQHPEYLNGQDPRILEEVYFGRNPQSALAKVPDLHKLMEFAESRGIAGMDLVDVEAVYARHNSRPTTSQAPVQQVIQDRVAQIPQTRNVAQVASNPPVDGSLGYTDSQIADFRNLRAEIPDDWYENGRPVYSRIPTALHDIV